MTLSINVVFMTLSINVLFMTLSINVGFMTLSINVGFMTLSINVGFMTLSINVGFMTLSINVGFIPSINQESVCGGIESRLLYARVRHDYTNVPAHGHPIPGETHGPGIRQTRQQVHSYFHI